MGDNTGENLGDNMGVNGKREKMLFKESKKSGMR